MIKIRENLTDAPPGIVSLLKTNNFREGIPKKHYSKEISLGHGLYGVYVYSFNVWFFDDKTRLEIRLNLYNISSKTSKDGVEKYLSNNVHTHLNNQIANTLYNIYSSYGAKKTSEFDSADFYTKNDYDFCEVVFNISNDVGKYEFVFKRLVVEHESARLHAILRGINIVDKDFVSIMKIVTGKAKNHRPAYSRKLRR